MSEHKGQNYLHGAAILTAGVIIMKILGFLYKMPIGNILGDDGYSMFLASYNVYNVFLTLSTAGLPIALARMVSEANAQGRVNQLQRTFSVAWRTFFWVGLFCSLIMALFPHQIADRILREGAPAVDDYMRFLCAGGSLPPLDALRLAGVDMENPQTVRDALRVFADAVDRLEGLLA